MVIHKITKYEFIQRYLANQVANNELKLSPNEIRLIAHLMIFNDNKKPRSPYYGTGRDELLANMGISTSALSQLFTKLTKKELLIKLQKDGDYALSVKLQKLNEYINSNSKLSIVNYYELVV